MGEGGTVTSSGKGKLGAGVSDKIAEPGGPRGPGEGGAASEIDRTGEAGWRTSMGGPARTVDGGEDEGIDDDGGAVASDRDLSEEGSRGEGVGRGEPA